MLTQNDLASRAAGYLALGCAVWSHIPQLIETWCQETGTGASYLFLGMWILGDASNVVAAVVHGLLTQQFLSAWYTLGDLVWLGLILYYKGELPFTKNRRNKKAHDHVHVHGITSFSSERPTVGRSANIGHSLSHTKSTLSYQDDDGKSYFGHAGPEYTVLSLGHSSGSTRSRARSSSSRHNEPSSPTSTKSVPPRRQGFKGTIMFYCFENKFTKHLFNAIFFCGVIPALMMLIWYLTAYRVRDTAEIEHRTDSIFDVPGAEGLLSRVAWALGWLGTALYNLPRLYNFYLALKDKYVEDGWSKWLFLSLMGENIFTLMSIFTVGTNEEHLVAESPFILGACLGIIFDIVFLGLMWYFKQRTERIVSAGGPPPAKHGAIPWSAMPYTTLAWDIRSLPVNKEQDKHSRKALKKAKLDFARRANKPELYDHDHDAMMERACTIMDSERQLHAAVHSSEDPDRIEKHTKYQRKHKETHDDFVKAHARVQRRAASNPDADQQADSSDDSFATARQRQRRATWHAS